MFNLWVSKPAPGLRLSPLLDTLSNFPDEGRLFGQTFDPLILSEGVSRLNTYTSDRHTQKKGSLVEHDLIMDSGST